MDLLALSAAVSILVAVVALGLAFGSVPVRAQLRTRLEGVLLGATPVVEGTSIDPLRTRRGLGMFQSIVSGAWLQRMERDLRLADSRLQPADLLAIKVALAGLGFAIPFVLLSDALGSVGGIVGGLAAALVGFQLPQFWVKRRKAARSKKLEEQLPEALTMVANSLKAGFGLLQALSLAGEQLEHPIGTEFALTVHETNVGSSTEEAFQALSERNGNYDLDLVVTAVLVQRSAGGNLAEILETVTQTMRERTRIRGEIATLTAQQKLTGIVIALLPVAVGAMFLLVSPSYITLLFTDPLGLAMLGIGGFLELIGILVIQRILAIEV